MVVDGKLETLEQVQREEEAKADVLHHCVRNVEQDHVEAEREESDQWLKLLQLGGLLAFEGHEPARLASHPKEPSAKRKHPGDPVERTNWSKTEARDKADGDIDDDNCPVQIPSDARIVKLLHFSHCNVTSCCQERIGDQEAVYD